MAFVSFHFELESSVYQNKWKSQYKNIDSVRHYPYNLDFGINIDIQ